MKNLANFIITLGVFYLGNRYFNEYISIADNKTLLIAAASMLIMNVLFGLLMMTSMMSIFVGVGCITTPILILAMFMLTPIKLLILSIFLPGFSIHGFWIYVLLSLILGIFSLKTQTKTTNKNNHG